jgi:hypothetical protein
MEGIEGYLKSEYPEATEAEVKRFVRAFRGSKNTHPAQVKKAAEQALEDYLDWRSCYGLDQESLKESSSSSATTGNNCPNSNDVEDWNFAVEKSLEVTASMRRAQEQAKKLRLEEEQAKNDVQVAQPVSYDIDVSDADDDGKEREEEAGEVDEGNSAAMEQSGEQTKNQLPQIIYLNTDESGKALTDKDGGRILHVLPALINRQAANADLYAMILCFYLDRKFDRASEEKVTVVIDVRAGEGWPNPVAFMMIKFVRTVAIQLQSRYPERLKSLVVFPVPWAAMGVWTAIKRVFGIDMMHKITLVAGPADRTSPVPKSQLEALIDGDVLDFMEKFRLKQFKPLEVSTVTSSSM